MTYFFKKPFAENGDVTQIPVNSPGDGTVSYSEGWPEGYELDPTQNPDDARNLSRTNFNGLFFNITSVLQQFQQYGVNPYITAADNGGEPFAYPQGGECWYIDPTTGIIGVYRSTTSNNTTYPSVNGYTNRNWQRIWEPGLDTIKSNRIRNALLNMPTKPYLMVDDVAHIGAVTIPAGMRVLFSEGWNNDNTLKSEILTYINDVTGNVDLSNENQSFCIFATSTSSILIVNAYAYLGVSSSNPGLENALPATYYYFNTTLNKWMKKEQAEETFSEMDYSLCLVGTLSNVNGTWELALESVLELNTTSNSSNSSSSSGSSSSSDSSIDLSGFKNYDIETTNFCVNRCNLNSSNEPDFLSTDSVVIAGDTIDIIKTYWNNATITYTPEEVTWPGSAWYSGGGFRFYGKGMVNAPAPIVSSMTFKLNEPVRMMASPSSNPTSRIKFVLSSPEVHLIYNKNGDMYYDAHIIRYNHVSGKLWFTDGTYSEFMNEDCRWRSQTWQNTQSGTGHFTDWKEFNIITNSDKYVDKLEFTVTSIAEKGWTNGSGWRDYVYSMWTYCQAVFSNINLWIQQSQVAFSSNQLKFKIGSNYLEQVSTATPLISPDRGTIEGDRYLNDIWKGQTICAFVSRDQNEIAESSFTFTESPAATTNAKLFFRFLDYGAYSFIGELTITLTYSDDSTEDLVSGKFMYESQDLLLSIPDGKIIKKVTISATKLENPADMFIGLIQVYNNVSAGATFTQYPALYATSGDGQKYIMNFDCPPINVDHSGYIMVSDSMLYILPSTNVIYKQKTKPASPHEGDVWFDYAREPLMAWKYQNGQWIVFKDVPCGFVEVTYLSPTATATTNRQALAVSVNAATFQTKLPSGTYVFSYTTAWKLDGRTVTLSTYGITITSGTAQNGDTITVEFSSGDQTITSLTHYDINQNGYNVNAFTTVSGALVGRDGRDGKDGMPGRNGNDGPQGPAGVGLPTGGLTGQVLAKSSNANYATTWTSMASNALFDGGQAGETLIKNSSENLDFSWAPMPSGIPNGGTTGQALIKASNIDKDVTWGAVESLPTGGQAGQVLKKRSNQSYDVEWGDAGASLTIYDNDTSFMFGVYFYAQANGYSAVTIENFHSNTEIDGVNDDGAAVLSTYYSNVFCDVMNSSANSISFRLNQITSVTQVSSLVAHWQSEGTVSLYISTDTGNTWEQLSDYVEYSLNYVNSFIIKITLAAGASIKNIALITK